MTEPKQRRKPRTYTDEFKKQLVDLYHSGKRRCDICCEYDIAHSLFDKWVKQAENSGSFHEDESQLAADITDIFKASRNNYGTRKIKKELEQQGKIVSRRRIGRIMKKEGLVSNDTTAQFKPQKDTCNKSRTENILNRQFQGQCYRTVVVSDLTYVRVGTKWNYICVLADLFNREIIGYSAGEHKTAELVKEATFKIIKTEFVWNETSHSLEELKLKLWDYVNWYNCHRIHSSLGYL